MKIPTIESINDSVNAILPDIIFRYDKRLRLFLDQPQDKRIEILRKAPKSVRKDLLIKMPEADLVAILSVVDPDQATDMLQLLTKTKRESVLVQLGDEIKDSLSTLLEFDADTAAGLMTLDYISVDFEDNIKTVAQKFKTHESRTGRLPIILVKKDDKLSGVLPAHELGLASRSELIGKYVKRIPTISYAADHQKVVDKFRAHPHNKIAVLNDGGDIMGIIYSDDVLQLIEEKEAATLYDFAGVSSEEGVSDSASRKVKFRYKWLIINLGTAFLASFVVGQFQSTISQYVLLAVYMPIVAGMGGNAATQTLAVLVRGIALKQISLRSSFKTLKNEVGAGFFNGLINGFLVAFVVLVKDHDAKIALILALAMVINLIVAALFGTMVPLVMSKLRKDPATSATIFITTATDVLGFLAFLGLATIILH